MCPVFTALAEGEVRPVATEVADVEWVPWPQFRAAALDGSRELSPWCVEQVRLLPEDPRSAAQADADRLPPAARPATAS
jgi:isopentenyl-diphosphate delta-isomerase